MGDFGIKTFIFMAVGYLFYLNAAFKFVSNYSADPPILSVVILGAIFMFIPAKIITKITDSHELGIILTIILGVILFFLTGGF